METKERKLKFDAEIRTRLPPGMPPLVAIRNRGCDNPYFELSENAKRMICKYDYCGCSGLCRVGC